MTPPDQLKPSVEAQKTGAEAAPVAPKETQDPAQTERKEVTRTTSRSLAENAEVMQKSEAERKLESFADDAVKGVKDIAKAATGGALSASNIEKFGNNLSGITETITNGITPLIETFQKLFENLKKGLAPALAKFEPILQSFGMELPEWIVDRIAGKKELEVILKQNGRTLISTPEDAVTMREVLAIHHTMEKGARAEKKAYATTDFFKDIAAALPATKSEVTVRELKTEAERIAQEKEDAKKAEKKKEEEPKEETKTDDEKKAPESQKS